MNDKCLKGTVAFFTIFLCLSFSVMAQELTVKGKVISVVDGTPLIGVNVSIKGTETGTATDNRGEYNLKVDVPSYADVFYRDKQGPILVFSYTGFRTLELPVKGRPLIDVVLQPETEILEEVVVTGNAVGKSATLMSYSVGKIGDDLLEPVNSIQLGAGLQGKVAGLRVNQIGGQPGQGVFFQIRAANAIANGQQPLIIVDGTFLNGTTLADINPEDVHRVEVLKGSAGASLYGSQAANGVIQIFTKRGKDLEVGETKVVYQGEFGYSEGVGRYDLNEFTNREILLAEGPQPILGNPTANNIHDNPLPNLQDYQEDILFQRGMISSNQVVVSGKRDRTNFYFSGQRLQDKGVIQTSDGYTRNAFRFNFDYQLSNKFTLGVNSFYSTSAQDLLASVSNGANSFLATTLSLTPIFGLESANEEDGSSFDWDIDNTGFSITNPLYDRANSRQSVDRTRLTSGLNVKYFAKPWLVISYEAGLDRSVNSFQHFVHKGYLSSNLPGLFGPGVVFDLQTSNGGGIQRSQRVNNSLVSRTSISLQRIFGDWSIGARASYLYEDLTEKFNEGRGENLAVTGVESLDNARSNVFISSEEEQVVANSAFLVGDVDYKKKYIFSGLFRVEGSSLFGSEERWSNYYRISAGYRVTEDINIKGFEELKLRASIGTAGIRPTFGQRFETFDLVNGDITKNTLGNRFLKPAQSTELEVGADAVIGKAFTLEFNYANITTEDQILLVPRTAATGFRGQWRNAGTIEAQVYEARLGINFARLFKMDNKGFDWNLYTSFDRTEQTVSELAAVPYTTGPGLQASSLFLVQEGVAFGTMVGEVFVTDVSQLEGQEGVNPADFEKNAAGYLVHRDLLGTPEEVPVKLVDASGNPLIEPIGDINPDFRMGFANLLTYKDFELYTLFDWKKGGDVYNMTKHWLYQDQRHGDVSRYPDIAASFYGVDGLYNNLVANSHFVEDASFFMLREASVSYTFRQKQLQGIFGSLVQDLKISLVGRNLLTSTNYSGYHPDITSPPRDENTLTNRFPDARGSDNNTPNGDPALFYVDAFSYPVRRIVSFSLRATF